MPERLIWVAWTNPKDDYVNVYCSCPANKRQILERLAEMFDATNPADMDSIEVYEAKRLDVDVDYANSKITWKEKTIT